MRKILPVNGGGVSGGGTPQVQSDWAEANPGAVDYIKNKPVIPTPVPVPDWISLGADIPPNIADPLNDEFSGALGFLDPKWTYGRANANTLLNCDGFGNLWSRLQTIGGSGGQQIMLQPKPVAPCAFVAKVHYSPGLGGGGNQYLGICARDSVGGNFLTWHNIWQAATTNRWEVARWNTPASLATYTFNTSVQGTPWFGSFWWYLKFYDDGTNFNFQLSQDGLNYFLAIASQARAAWVPGGGNQIGIFTGNDSGLGSAWLVEYFRRVL